jgi:hypothetical protein
MPLLHLPRPLFHSLCSALRWSVTCFRPFDFDFILRSRLDFLELSAAIVLLMRSRVIQSAFGLALNDSNHSCN